MKALVVVDMQAKYLTNKNKFENKNIIIRNINKRINNYLEHNNPVLYVRDIRQKSNPEFVQELILTSNLIFDKDASSSFSNPLLENYLKSNQIDELEIAGIDGNCCVKSTALDAANKGYKVTINLSDIGVINKERFEKTKDKLKKASINIIEEE